MTTTDKIMAYREALLKELKELADEPDQDVSPEQNTIEAPPQTQLASGADTAPSHKRRSRSDQATYLCSDCESSFKSRSAGLRHISSHDDAYLDVRPNTRLSDSKRADDPRQAGAAVDNYPTNDSGRASGRGWIKRTVGGLLRWLGPTPEAETKRQGRQLADLIGGEADKLEKQLHDLNPDNPELVKTLRADFEETMLGIAMRQRVRDAEDERFMELIEDDTLTDDERNRLLRDEGLI